MKVFRIFLLILFIAAGNAFISASPASVKSGSKTKVYTIEDVKNGLDCEIEMFREYSSENGTIEIKKGKGFLSFFPNKTKIPISETTVNRLCYYINIFYISKTSPIILNKRKRDTYLLNYTTFDITFTGMFQRRKFHNRTDFWTIQGPYLITFNPEFLNFAHYIDGIVHHYGKLSHKE